MNQLSEQDIKERFYAQYFGQRVLVLSFDNNTSKKYYEIGQTHGVTGIITSSHLELTPLSDISDEDAVELCNIIRSTYPDYFIKGLYNDTYICNVSYCVQATDYLRSKGYALPFMGISVEEQIERGWVKLRKNEQ